MFQKIFPKFSGVWFGGSPHFKRFFGGLISDLIKLGTGLSVSVQVNEFVTEERNVQIKLLLTILDMPANRKLYMFKEKNADCGCVVCLNPGTPHPLNPLIRYYLCDKSYPSRKEGDVTMAQESSENTGKGVQGLAGRSVMSEYTCILDIMTIDPMHNIFLGNCLRILSLFLDSGFHDQEWYIKPEKQLELDAELRGIKIPTTFHKNVRSIIKDLAYFKADELRMFALYFLPVFKQYIISKYHQFLDDFREACTISSSKYPSEADLKRAGLIFKNVSNNSKTLFGNYCATMNMHCLEHIGIYLARFGPFFNFSAFGSEGLVGTFMSFRSGTYRFQNQMIWMFNSLYYLDLMETRNANSFTTGMKDLLRRMGSTNFKSLESSVRVTEDIYLLGKPKTSIEGIITKETYMKCTIKGFPFKGRDKTINNRNNNYSCKYWLKKVDPVTKEESAEEKRGDILRFERFMTTTGKFDKGTTAVIVDLLYKPNLGQTVYSVNVQDIIEPLLVVKTSKCFYTCPLVGPMNDLHK